MKGLYFLCEGETEKAFVLQKLYPHFIARGTYDVEFELPRKTRGGIKRYGNFVGDLKRALGAKPNRRVVTTLFDFYRLPTDFPEYPAAQEIQDKPKRCDFLQDALKRDLNHAENPNFLPYIQLHEFEALVFALSPEEIEKSGFAAVSEIQAFRALKEEMKAKNLAPEDVNDGSETSPSNRLKRVFPSYRKPLHGPALLEKASLDDLREACPRFSAWLDQLERQIAT